MKMVRFSTVFANIFRKNIIDTFTLFPILVTTTIEPTTETTEATETTSQTVETFIDGNESHSCLL